MRSTLARCLIFATLCCASVASARGEPDRGWVLLEGRDAAHMSGSSGDVDAARALQKGDEPLLYLRRDGKAWVIRDAATLAKVRAAWAPARKVGAKMEPLGKKMELIGGRMGQVGEKMEPIGERMGEVGVALASERDEARREALRAEMDGLQEKMRVLQQKMEALSAEMKPFSSEMERLGAEMQPLADRAHEETDAIAGAAIENGTATRAPDPRR